MEITFAPRGILQMDGVRLIHRNFEGRESQYNRKGDRNFSIAIYDEELAQRLVDEGWNVKIKPPREEGEAPRMHLPVKVKFNDRGPNVYLSSGSARGRRLNEETISCLDYIDILDANLDIRPYNWDINGKQGRTAYLQSLEVIQDVDRFADRYAEEEYPYE